jgi:hypothetical protein
MDHTLNKLRYRMQNQSISNEIESIGEKKTTCASIFCVQFEVVVLGEVSDLRSSWWRELPWRELEKAGRRSSQVRGVGRDRHLFSRSIGPHLHE